MDTCCIGLTNPKSPTNVGAVMRAAGCFRANAVFYTGERYNRARQFNTDTQNANLSIPLTRADSLLDCVTENMKVVCIELVEGAIPLSEFEHPPNAFYIFGPEDGTVSQRVIDKADAVVFIPTVGSLNLGATVNVVLYDRLAKSEHSLSNNAANNDLIRQSRDNNNKAKVR